MLKAAFTRQRKTLDPCPKCFLHRIRCICHLIPHLNLRTRITLVIHAKELKRTTNTGGLAMHALRNSNMCIRGQTREAVDLSAHLPPEYETYLLYPSLDARDVEQIKVGEKPIHLLVPDGNWRQASKVHTRHPELAHIPRVKVRRPSVIVAAQGALRKEHFAEGMATLEAIAYAMAHFEGAPAAKSLLDLYHAKLSATIAGRPSV